MITKPPFSTAKKLIESNNIQNLFELLEAIPKTTLAKAMKTSPKRFNRLIKNPTLFTFEDAYTLAELIGVDKMQIVSIIHSECQ